MCFVMASTYSLVIASSRFKMTLENIVHAANSASAVPATLLCIVRILFEIFPVLFKAC